MSGTVNQSTIRTDVWQETVDRLQSETPVELVEKSTSLREEDIIEPFERARTTEARSLDKVYELFKNVLEAAREYDGLAYDLGFSRESPPEEPLLPTVTFKLLSRGPWKDNSGRKELRARHMEFQKDPDNPGDVIETLQRRQINNIEMRVWAKTGTVASELAEWIEDKFHEYLHAFAWGGLAHPPLWIGRGRDTEELVKNQRVFYCPMEFQIITTKITEVRETALRQLQIKMGIMSNSH